MRLIEQDRDELLILGTTALALAEALAEAGYDPEPVFGPAGIDLERLHEEGFHVPSRQFDQAWHNATELTKDALFGIKVTERLHPGYWGVAGHAVYASETLEEAWNRFARYARIVSAAAHVLVQVEPPALFFVAIPAVRTVRPERLLTLAVLALKICRDLHSERVIPSSVTLTALSRTLSVEEHCRASTYFGCDVAFDGHCVRIGIPLAVARERVSAPNPSLALHLDKIADSYLDRPVLTLRQELEARVLRMLPRLPSLESVAAELRICPRTLQRRLRGEGTTFQSVVDEARMRITSDYLRHSTKPLKEVAYSAGFTDQSNFAKACRNWFGISPTGFRQAHIE